MNVGEDLGSFIVRAAAIYDVHSPCACGRDEMEKYALGRNVILGIIKTYYNIVKTRPSNVNCTNINAIAMGSTHV